MQEHAPCIVHPWMLTGIIQGPFIALTPPVVLAHSMRRRSVAATLAVHKPTRTGCARMRIVVVVVVVVLVLVLVVVVVVLVVVVVVVVVVVIVIVVVVAVVVPTSQISDGVSARQLYNADYVGVSMGYPQITQRSYDYKCKHS